MYTKLIETENAEINQTRVDFIQKILSKLQRVVGYVLEDNAFKIEENEKIIDNVKCILELNDKIRLGKGLKNTNIKPNPQWITNFFSPIKNCK